MKEHYSVVVVGSGYGGGVSASRLARTGQSVCVLERGKEFLPGEFPSTLPEATEETQLNTQARHIGSKTGLFDFNINDEMNVLVGCGLGGTSLINANVVIKADPRVFEAPIWPESLLKDLDHGIAHGYERAIEMLKPSQYPNSKEFPPLKKLGALEKSAKFMNEDFYRVNIAVNFDTYENDLNHVGVKQTPCIMCGDCVSGCNHTSKNTVQMNYLPDAWNHGAEIFTGALVRYVEKRDNGWIVHYEVAEAGQDKFKAPDQFVSADVVILAAGTLGSTELLLRSRENGLKISDRIGKRFSGNGDFLGFSYDCDEEINGIGWGDREPDPNNLVGPCITGIIDTRKNAVNYKEGMSIEEGSIPGALSPILPIMFLAISKFIGVDTDHGFTDYLKEKKRELESLLLGSYRGAVDNTQIYLVMTHDSAEGVMLLKDDRLRIDWPGAGKEEIFKKVQERLLKSTEALGGTFVTNPVWTKIMGHDLMTVHPLGGSVMSDDASTGVVNHKGQVFSSATGDEFYEGLYVADGSIIPTSLGTNPLLTISAIAERNVSLLAKDNGWDFDYDLPSKPASAAPPLKPWIQFTESKKGYFSTRVKDDYGAAANPGTAGAP